MYIYIYMYVCIKVRSVNMRGFHQGNGNLQNIDDTSNRHAGSGNDQPYYLLTVKLFRGLTTLFHQPRADRTTDMELDMEIMVVS